MKLIDAASTARRRLSLRLERNLALIFGALGLMLIALTVLHWLLVLEPALRAEAQSRSSALAQAQVQGLEKLLGSGIPPARLRAELQTALDAIVLLKDQSTGSPFIRGIALRVDYDLLGVPSGSLDLATGAEVCSNCFVDRVPLYHPVDRLLIAVATCYSSKQFLEHLVRDLRTKLIWVVGVILFVILFAWLETSRLLGRLRESELNLRNVFEAAPFPMVLGAEGQLGLRQANQAARSYLDLQEDDRGLLSSESWLTLYAAGLPLEPGEQRETRVPSADGRLKWALVSTKPLRFSGGASRLITLVDVTELKKIQDELRSASFTDSLTGLYNRRYLYLRLAKEIDLVRRYRHPLSIVLFDLDHFKSINDTFGHRVGDEVLTRAASVLVSCAREVDVAGRYGGEEFLLILPHSDRSQACEVAERIRRVLNDFSWPQEGLQVTLSGGVTQYAGESLDELIDQADQRLYRAKEAGRNRVVSD